jgi:hypothetical protein
MSSLLTLGDKGKVEQAVQGQEVIFSLAGKSGGGRQQQDTPRRRTSRLETNYQIVVTEIDTNPIISIKLDGISRRWRWDKGDVFQAELR